MPWKVRKKKSQYCVEKSDGGAVPGGCHATNAEAQAHLRALYAGEENAAVSASAVTVVGMKNGETVNLVWGPPQQFTVQTEMSTFASVTTSEDAPPAEREEGAGEIPGVKWKAILAFEGIPTSDRRYLMPGQIEHRELPLSIMVQTKTAEGHDGAELAGRIDAMWWQDSESKEGVIEIHGDGPFADNEAGREALSLIENEFLNRVSIDFAPTEHFLLDPETYEEVDTEGMDIFEAILGDYVTGFAGSIMGATFVPFSAFEDAFVEVVTASGSTVLISGRIEIVREEAALTASGAGMAPLAPPKEWFEMPEADRPTPLTVDDDGRVFGHLATWDECHSGFRNECVLAPRSRSDYSAFHLGELKTEEGDRVSVGRITVGKKGHAPIHLDADAARQYYDETGCVAAFVKAKDGRHGIWLSGAVRSDAPAEKVRDMMANPPSGDWRNTGGGLELQGVLSVPIPGFPVPRHEYHLVASGTDGEEHMEALVVQGYGSQPMGPRQVMRRRAMMRSRLEQMGIVRRPRTREEIRKSALKS